MTFSRQGTTLIHHGPGTKTELRVHEDQISTLRELLDGIEAEYEEGE